MISMAATSPLSMRPHKRPVLLAAVAGLACALAAGKTLPLTMDRISGVLAPLCIGNAAAAGSPLDKVEVITSHALPNVPGKRVTIVRVFYGPGGFSRAHRHAGSVTAYITKGEIRSQLGGGPVETFGVGQSFFGCSSSARDPNRAAKRTFCSDDSSFMYRPFAALSQRSGRLP